MKFWFEIIASGRFVILYLPSNKKCFDRPTRKRTHTFFYRSKCNRTNYSGKWSQSASIQCVLIFHVSPNTPQPFMRPFRHSKENNNTAWHSIQRKMFVFFTYLFGSNENGNRSLFHVNVKIIHSVRNCSQILWKFAIARVRFIKWFMKQIHIFLCSSKKKITLNCTPNKTQTKKKAIYELKFFFGVICILWSKN